PNKRCLADRATARYFAKCNGTLNRLVRRIIRSGILYWGGKDPPIRRNHNRIWEANPLFQQDPSRTRFPHGYRTLLGRWPCVVRIRRTEPGKPFLGDMSSPQSSRSEVPERQPIGTNRQRSAVACGGY